MNHNDCLQGEEKRPSHLMDRYVFSVVYDDGSIVPMVVMAHNAEDADMIVMRYMGRQVSCLGCVHKMHIIR